MNPTSQQIDAWRPVGRPLAMNLAARRVDAQCIREHVRSYSVPLWQSFGFREPDGTPITDPDRSYLMGDDHDQDVRWLDYLSQLRAAHLEHGYQVEADQCPALVADRDRVLAEDALLDSFCSAMGIRSFRLYGRLRERMIDLAMRAVAGEGVAS